MTGEVVLTKTLIGGQTRSIFTPPANLGFTFGGANSTDWATALRTYDTDVAKILHKIDDELHRLGCFTQRDRDALLARHIPAALPTAEYSVVTEQVA